MSSKIKVQKYQIKKIKACHKTIVVFILILKKKIFEGDEG